RVIKLAALYMSVCRGYGSLVPVLRQGRQERERDGKVVAEIQGVVGAFRCGVGPEVQGIAGPAAFEAVEGVALEVGGGAAAGAGIRAGQGAWAALLGALAAARPKAEEGEDGGHSDGGANRGEVGRKLPIISGFGVNSPIPTNPSGQT